MPNILEKSSNVNFNQQVLVHLCHKRASTFAYSDEKLQQLIDHLDRNFLDEIELGRVNDLDGVRVRVADDDLSQHRALLPNDLSQLAGVHAFDSGNPLLLQPRCQPDGKMFIFTS